MRKSKAQLSAERESIKAHVIMEITRLCKDLASRSLTVNSSAETMDMLFLWFALAWGGRLFKHNEIPADTLTELVANEFIASESLPEAERYRQCAALSTVWRSWEFVAKKCFSIGDAKMHWYFHTRTLHPSSRRGTEK
jgi:hypothetical protein